jgi:immunity protein 26 of polymorphic toxin system
MGVRVSKQLPYQEGTEFLVPLAGGGFARGVVARMTPKGKRGNLLLGYFFGPRLSAQNSNLPPTNPSDAVMVGRFGDLHLFDGKWQIIGQMPQWVRSQWPIPEFIKRDPLGMLPDQVVVYADDLSLGQWERRAVIPDGLPEDCLMGAGAVEIRLEKLLADR